MEYPLKLEVDIQDIIVRSQNYIQGRTLIRTENKRKTVYKKVCGAKPYDGVGIQKLLCWSRAKAWGKSSAEAKTRAQRELIVGH